MTFNPSKYLMQIKTKDGLKPYLAVQYRVLWFRTECVNGTIETELIQLELDREVEETVKVWNDEKKRYESVVKRANGYALFKATVTDGMGGTATGYKCENAASFPDYVEKAETGAVGRALALLGYGTAFTGDELNERHRIVDTPANRKPPTR